MPKRVDEVRFIIDRERLKAASSFPRSLASNRFGLSVMSCEGVGGALDSVDAGVTSNVRRGIGRRMDDSSMSVADAIDLVGAKVLKLKQTKKISVLKARSPTEGGSLKGLDIYTKIWFTYS